MAAKRLPPKKVHAWEPGAGESDPATGLAVGLWICFIELIVGGILIALAVYGCSHAS